MDALDWFSLAGRIWPRLVATVIAIGFIAFPHTADALFMDAVHERAEEIGAKFKPALRPLRLHHELAPSQSLSTSPTR